MGFSEERAYVISEITRDIGQVFFASAFVGPLFSSGELNWLVMFFGIGLSVVFWAISVAAINKT